MGDGGYNPDLVPRLCHIVRWPEFNGYGFNLHAEKGKAGQFIGKVDEGSPAEAAGLKAGDRIVEVNGTNIGNENHQQVVGRIKSGGDETRLLVVDQETDQHYKEDKKVVRGDLPEVKFLTAARDDEENQIEVPQMEDSVPAAVIGDSNGTEPEPQTVTEDTSQYVPRLCNLCKWPDFDGYGFNLHAEKEKPGQYIGIVDPDSPADLGGLKEGDRIIEVNGENIEASNHTVVIQKIKSKGDKTSMLVVDKATDDYFKRQGQTVCSSMTSVVVISTPPRLAVVDTTMNQQDTVQAAAAVDNVVVPQGATQVAAAAVDTGIEQQDAAQVSAAHHDWVSTTVEEQTSGVVDLESAEEDFPAPPQALTAAEWDVGEDTGLPEPNVSLSDSEETGDRVTAVVAEQVESAPVPDEVQAVQNGTEEVAEGVATVCVEGEAEVAPPEEIVGGGGVVDYHPYEEVDVTATTAAAATTTVVSSYQEEAGTATNGMNGGSVGEAAVVSQTSEAEPAVIHSTTTTTTTTITTGGAADGDLNLNLSAAEMKERLKMRKKQDPRHSKTSFETKYKMFEKM